MLFLKFGVVLLSLVVNVTAHAAIFEKDDRDIAARNYKTLGLSFTEYQQAKRCTGRITCPDLRGKNNSYSRDISAGAFCAPGARQTSGRCVADRIVTAPRVFVDSERGVFYPNLEKCEFSNYEGFITKLKISDLTSVVDTKSPTESPDKSARADKVVIRLSKAISGCDPYDTLPGATSPAGTDLIAVTYPQEDMPEAARRGNEPLTYKCKVLKSYQPRYSRAGVIYSDCDLTSGGVGGVTLIRNENNRLIMNSILSNSPAEKYNGVPANVETKMYTNSVATNGDFLIYALQPGVRLNLEPLPVPPPAVAPVPMSTPAVDNVPVTPVPSSRTPGLPEAAPTKIGVTP